MVEDIADDTGLTPGQIYQKGNELNWNEKKIKQSIQDGQFVELTGQKSKSGTFTCTICWDDFKSEQGYSLICDHEFCRDCFTDYVKEKVDAGVTKVLCECPQECGVYLTYDDYRELLKKD